MAAVLLFAMVFFVRPLAASLFELVAPEVQYWDDRASFYR